jgi:hypothetical protein
MLFLLSQLEKKQRAEQRKRDIERKKKQLQIELDKQKKGA